MNAIADRNEAVIRALCDSLSRRDVAGVIERMADNGTWTLAGRQDRFAFAGTQDKAGQKALLTAFLGGFSTFEFVVEHTVAQGDRVAVQARSHGTGPGRKVYKNTYLLMFRLEDGLVVEAQEYLDPFEVLDYVEQPE